MRISIPPTAVHAAPASGRRRGSAAVVRPQGSDDYIKLLQGIYDGVIITDAKGRVLDFNGRALVLFGAEDGTFAGTRVIDLICGADVKLLSAIHQNLGESRYTVIEAQCVRMNGTVFYAEIAVNKIDLHERGSLCFLFRDVSVRKKTEADLELAIKSLEAHDRARLQFVSNVSHELRTPLTSMIYAVSNMLRGVLGPIPPRVHRYLEMLDGDCHRLLNTVNDILDLRKVETSTMTLNRHKVPLGRLVTRCIQTLRVQAEQKSLTVEAFTGTRRWFVDVDPQKMERVVVNVVGNAVKFTPEGGRVDIVVGRDPSHAGRVLFSVQDTGVGIPRDAIEKVTVRFFTVGEQPSGSGLGLAISKEIVELHGGHIEIKSPPPGARNGTIVYISLPVVDPPRILVAEGDEAVHNVVEQQLCGQGYRVLRARGGEATLDTVRALAPDLVVFHLARDDSEVTETVLRMKGDHGLRRIPVIVLADDGVAAAKAEILSTFSVPALANPWQESDLLDSVGGSFMR